MGKRQPILFDLILFSFFLFFCLFFLFPKCLASEERKVEINEIAWMGTEKSANDEWIELYNNANYGISLNSWSLKAQDSINIELTGTIPAKGFYILERTDDQSLPEIPADIIFKGPLSNKGKKLGLYDGNGVLVDEVDCSGGWFKGDNSSKQTMERISFGKDGSSADSWQTSALAGGTPKKENSLIEKQEYAKQAIAANSPDYSFDGNIDAARKTIGLKKQGFSFLYSFFSGIIIVFLKRSLNNQGY